MSQKNYDVLCETIGHFFSSQNLLVQALNHPSCLGRIKPKPFQRLEFLGDRVLGLVIAQMLYESFPDEEEGDLAKRFVSLTRRETLADVARQIDLASYIKLSKAEQSNIKKHDVNILSDACEALIAALYFDAGMGVAQKFIKAFWSDHLQKNQDPIIDAKSKLQQWAQARGLPLPKYRVISSSGPSHAPQFVVEVCVEGYDFVQGAASSKKNAEHVAAEQLLFLLEK